MFPSLSKSFSPTYHRLRGEDTTLPSSSSTSSPKPSSLRSSLKILSIGLIFTFLGFLIGQYSSKSLSPPNNPINLRTKPRLFRYDPLFGDSNGKESDAAWEGLFPGRGGFFTNPDVAKDRSAFAVFHQLHCLNALRTAYFTTLSWSFPSSPSTSTSKPSSPSDIPFEISPPHMQHCVDLLRQTLMCNPDLTVEKKNETLGGVTGFGTVHQCRDWDGLMGWMGVWQDVGAPEHVGSGHHHHHGGGMGDAKGTGSADGSEGQKEHMHGEGGHHHDR